MPSSAVEPQIVVQSLDSRERRMLIEGGTHPRYLPTGHPVYMWAGNLLGYGSISTASTSSAHRYRW